MAMDPTLFNIEEIVAENGLRLAKRNDDPYDPLKGVGCCLEREEECGCLVPKAVLAAHPDYRNMTELERDRVRIVEDFEFWCARCVTIKDKTTGQNVKLVLNRPQRRMLAVMEGQRTAGLPIRVILLKARQWGGSTLVQMYMAWMQLVRHKGWNSLIVGHKQQTSKAIKRMYNQLLSHYPRELLDEGVKMLKFTKLEGQPNVQQIEQRECLVLTASSRSEDAVRGYDISMAHLSEVAFWQASPMHNPDDVVRSVCGSITLKPESVIVLESTARGVGDFFHDEWRRSQQGLSDKLPVFVPWHEIGIYSKEVDDVSALWESMDDYEHMLWRDGCTLEQINWYHLKRKENRTHEMMMSEYPGSDSEAFATTGNNPFDREQLDALEKGCHLAPLLVGDIESSATSGRKARIGIHLVKEAHGRLKVWEMPESGGAVKTKYMVVVDVGGRADNSDYSVIAVWRLKSPSRKAAIVAQWRGHIDHDRLGWKSMNLAVFYNNAELVIESNTLTNEAARAGESDYILKSLREAYDNIYYRDGGKLGFHTNAKTKPEAITALIAALREGSYIERDIDAVNEMRDYEEINGRYAARPGKHDDILMTRAIGLLVIRDREAAVGTMPDKSLAVDSWLEYRPCKHGGLYY